MIMSGKGNSTKSLLSTTFWDLPHYSYLTIQLTLGSLIYVLKEWNYIIEIMNVEYM
jgi:hypothetical protein